MEKKEEKTVFEKYKEVYVDKVESKFFELENAKSILGLISSSTNFPIVIDKREFQSQQVINQIHGIPPLLNFLIERWHEVFSVNPLKKNIIELIEGRMTETELKKIFISVKEIEKKYPEIQSSKLLDFVNFPDFSEVLKALEKVKTNWLFLPDNVKSFLKLEDVFNSSKPVILPEWEEKIRQSFYVKIDTEKQKEELETVFNFGVGFLEFLQKIGCRNQDQYDILMGVIESRRFIKLNNLSFSPFTIQNIAKMDSIGLLKR